MTSSTMSRSLLGAEGLPRDMLGCVWGGWLGVEIGGLDMVEWHGV